MRIVLFALPGPMALPVLQGLLELPVQVIGVVLPAPEGMPALTVLPSPASALKSAILMPQTVTTLAERAGMTRFAVSKSGIAELTARLHTYDIDLAIVACWPWRIPQELLLTPRLGFLNLHPSPLPELRGPEPLFWALRLGWTRTAMTLHLMDEELDHGPLVRQEWFDLPLGERLSRIELLAGQQAARMLPAALTDLQTPGWQPQAQPTGGSVYHAPQAADFTLYADWPVQRAYAFIRAVAEWGHPFTFIAADGQTTVIIDAIGYNYGKQPAPLANSTQIALQCCDGVLVAQLPPRV